MAEISHLFTDPTGQNPTNAGRLRVVRWTFELVGAPVIDDDGIEISPVSVLSAGDERLLDGGWTVDLTPNTGDLAGTYYRITAPWGSARYAVIPDDDPHNLVDVLVDAPPAPPAPIWGNPQDGQIAVWSSTVGAFVPANPTGASVLAEAVNGTGTVTTTTGTNTLIPSTVITVPASNGRNVRLEYSATFSQTVAGAGQALLLVWDVTASAFIDVTYATLPNTTTSTQNTVTIIGKSPSIGVLAASRQYAIYIGLQKPSGSPSISVLNGNGGAFLKSYLRALAS